MKTFETPEVEVICFNEEDIITASGCGNICNPHCVSADGPLDL